ncbi:PH domain-containing protein [Rossellomorea marisflavi]|uniref:PH domain-containing protein n=1 Tax=Rossellomorea marisflavi TaxID=189381 RepID=UPI00345AEDD7
MMSDYKRLHPISAIVNFMKQVKEMIIPIIVLLFVNGSGNGTGFWRYMPVISMVTVLVLVLGAGIIKWMRFTYRLEDGELRIEYGLFVKKKRYIPYDRIQSLNFSEGILHRPFGLVKVKVETAGSSSNKKSEAELTAILKEEAVHIEKTIFKEKERLSESPEAVVEEKPVRQEEIFKMSGKDLLMLGLTSGGVGVILSGVGVFLSQFDDFIPFEEIYEGASGYIKGGVLIIGILAFVGLFIAWLLSLVWTFVVYGDFRIRLTDENIIINRGLLEKKQVTVPFKRVQGIRIIENPVRQLLGYCSVQIENAGGSALEKDSSSIKLFPIVRKREVENLIAEIFPDYSVETEFNRLPVRSIRKYMIRAAAVGIIPTVVLSIFLWPYGMWGLILVALLAFLGYRQHKSGGWKLSEGQLSMQYRTVSKSTVYLKKNRIQSLDRQETMFQTRMDLSTLRTTVKSGDAGYKSTLRDLEQKDMKQIEMWYSYEE